MFSWSIALGIKWPCMTVNPNLGSPLSLVCSARTLGAIKRDNNHSDRQSWEERKKNTFFLLLFLIRSKGMINPWFDKKQKKIVTPLENFFFLLPSKSCLVLRANVLQLTLALLLLARSLLIYPLLAPSWVVNCAPQITGSDTIWFTRHATAPQVRQ